MIFINHDFKCEEFSLQSVCHFLHAKASAENKDDDS